MLQIDFMTINRVVVHTIPSRAADKSYVEPTGGDALVHIDPTVSEMVVGRISKSLGHHSHGIQADFFDVGAGSMFQRACSMMDGSDTEFVALARESAQRLAKVQQSKAFDPSKLIAMSGTVTASQRPFVAFVKADMEVALTEGKKGGQTVLEIMKNLFMTDSQRLYKIGFIARTASGGGKKAGQYVQDQHSIHIFDHLMTGTESRKAAFYFYSEFLGSDVSASDRRLTQDFYEKTLKFITEQDFSPSKRIDLIESLRAELRSNTQSVSVADFATTHLSAKDGPKYVSYMEKSKFPVHAITKDTEYVKNKLRRRQKITFTTGVQISTPADQVKDLIKITQNENGTSTVVIKGTVASNE
jgi:nucleoid-associated protein YejK